MTRIVLGNEVQQLNHLTSPVELCDMAGRTLGVFCPLATEGVGCGIKSPYPVEEIERRRKNRSGRPLAEIWRDLNLKDTGSQNQ
jgi:hypothetical protein